MSRFFFVGRRDEKLWFENHLSSTQSKEKVINVYGTGGIGKSSLLDEYKFMAKKRGIPFILLESKDFPHTQLGLMRQILANLHFTSDSSEYVSPTLSCGFVEGF
ncbi:MAG: hypothetical protein WD907_01725 [Bacilli bacterium]